MSNNNYREVWQYALDQIHEQYKKEGSQQETEFKLWFNMQYIEDTDNTITVSVPSEFLWLQMQKKGNVGKVIKKIEELTGQKNIEINHTVSDSTIAVPDEKEINTPQKIKKTEDPPKKTNEEKPARKHPQLREDFTFDTFVSGDNNNFAYNASIAVSKEPGKKFNPILLYGGVGLGKTHLMQAIGNYIFKEHDDKFKICYTSAEAFTNEFTSSLASKTTEKFKSKYRGLDVLLLDDIHFLQNKPALQEELFYTFNELRDHNSQMVFTCDRPITELKGFADRIQSRISNGLCVDLQPPNYETRRAILLKKLEILGKKIPDDVIDYIAKNVETNVRDLESALTKMIGYAELIQKSLTIEIAQQQLRDIFSNPSAGNITIDTIQKVVADEYQISVSDIKNKKRDQKFVTPRQIALYIARELTEYSFTELGNEFGGRDHSTAMHSYEKICSQMKIDSTLNARVQLLMKEIKDYKK
ncbi:MAG: chromosomal replication initiator protein DnaA [Treponema sp.]|nr:chromosomal replication initiator protein DnaA [Treponema sp.]